MDHIFITYGNERFKEPLRVIKRQARHCGFFHRIKVYTPKDIPSYISSTAIFNTQKGGGFWIWKPYIILDALTKAKEGDIIVYADAGCAFRKESNEWEEIENLLSTHDAIFFQYRESFVYPGWEQFCKKKENNSPKIKHWCKPSCTSFFVQRYHTMSFLEDNELWAGSMIIKKTPETMHIIQDWHDTIINCPDLIIDSTPQEDAMAPPFYNCHKHDQTILSILISQYRKNTNIAVIPETAESQQSKAAIVARRYRLGILSPWLAFKYRIYNMLHPYEI